MRTNSEWTRLRFIFILILNNNKPWYEFSQKIQSKTIVERMTPINIGNSTISLRSNPTPVQRYTNFHEALNQITKYCLSQEAIPNRKLNRCKCGCIRPSSDYSIDYIIMASILVFIHFTFLHTIILVSMDTVPLDEHMRCWQITI